MKTLLHTVLEDSPVEIQEVALDLCRLRDWNPRAYGEYSFFNFLEVVVKDDPDTFSLDHLAAPMVLHRKLETLQDHAVYAVCRELNNGDTLEPQAALTLLSFFKKRFSPLPSDRSPDGLTRHQMEMRIIEQRRKNAH